MKALNKIMVALLVLQFSISSPAKSEDNWDMTKFSREQFQQVGNALSMGESDEQRAAVLEKVKNSISHLSNQEKISLIDSMVEALDVAVSEKSSHPGDFNLFIFMDLILAMTSILIFTLPDFKNSKIRVATFVGLTTVVGGTVAAIRGSLDNDKKIMAKASQAKSALIELRNSLVNAQMEAELSN